MAVTGVAAVALISRLFPGSFPEGDLPTFLPGTVTRLSFPLGYWNGLAIFLALGVPLLLRLALVARSGLVRGLALAPMPVIAAAVYLTSSRGGVATALAGSLVLVVLTERRWAVAAALAASLVGAAVAIAVLLARDELVNGPLGTELVERQGRSAALLIALACLCTGVLYGLGVHLLEGSAASARPAGTDRRRQPPSSWRSSGSSRPIRLRASRASRRCRAPTSRRVTGASSRRTC